MRCFNEQAIDFVSVGLRSQGGRLSASIGHLYALSVGVNNLAGATRDSTP